MSLELILIVAVTLKFRIGCTQVILVSFARDSFVRWELLEILLVDRDPIEFVWVHHKLSLLHLESLWHLMRLELILVVTIALKLSVISAQVVLVRFARDSFMSRELLKVLLVDRDPVKLVWVDHILPLRHLESLGHLMLGVLRLTKRFS
jgi:hypothetical protein